MTIDILHDLRLAVVVHDLPEVVLVNLRVLASKGIWLVLVVVSMQVRQKCRSHVLVVRTWSHTRPHEGACILVALPDDQPAWEDDACEVQTKE